MVNELILIFTFPLKPTFMQITIKSESFVQTRHLHDAVIKYGQ